MWFNTIVKNYYHLRNATKMVDKLAMQGLCANPQVSEDFRNLEDKISDKFQIMAILAIKQADALIAELEKE